jgi:xylulokinase
MSLLAVDIGSSTCKAVVFASGGEVLAQGSAHYSPEFPRPSFAEIHPDKFWDAVCLCCRNACKDLTEPVQALCLSSHGETFVALDSTGRPLTWAILNQDGRATRQSAWIEEMFGRECLFQVTGLIAHPMYPVPKILWLRKNQPDVFSSTKCFASLIGYLLRKMQLPAYVDYSLASRYLAFDVRRQSWSEEVLSAADLKKDVLPVPVPAGTIAGKISSEAADQLGIPSGTPVVLGGHDQPCGALGSGVIAAGPVADSMGTYECLVAASDAPALSEKALNASLNSYCHVVPGKFVTIAYFPSGIMVKWFHDLLYADGIQETQSSTADREAAHYASLESHAPVGPTGLCVTPHLIGTCNPDFNPHARGIIAGLGPTTDRAQLYKGILEGIACELSIVTEALAKAVSDFRDIYATGGGSRSTLGLQLRASLSRRRIHIMRCQEAVCLGTAILAGVAVGEYESITEAVTALVKDCMTVEPDQELAASYRDQIKHYRQLRSTTIEQTMVQQMSWS